MAQPDANILRGEVPMVQRLAWTDEGVLLGKLDIICRSDNGNR